MASPELPPQRARSKTLAKKGESAPATRTNGVSTASLVKEAFGDALSVLEAHLELAVLEVREDARVAASIAATFGIGAALTFLAAGFLLAAVAFGLALVMPPWAACLVVGGVASVAALIGLQRELVLLIAEMCKHGRSDVTPPVSLADLSRRLGTTAATINRPRVHSRASIAAAAIIAAIPPFMSWAPRP